MRSIGYLLLTSLKNSLKEMLRNPARLIMTVSMLGLLVALPFLSSPGGAPSESLDIHYLKAAYFALLMVFVGLAVAKGTSSGDTFFEMSDVNLLFVSPVSPKSILLYGLVRALKLAFWVGFFIPYQYANLARGFNVHFGVVLLMLGGYMLAMTLCQTASLLLYSWTSVRHGLKKWIRAGAVLLYAPLIVPPALAFIRTGRAMDALDALAHSPLLDWLPVAGWGAGGVFSLASGDAAAGLLLLALIPLVGAALTFLILRRNVDYYEDVLVATETAFEKKRALKGGSVDGAGVAPARNVAVITGGQIGTGARAFLGKHLREARRGGGFFLGWASWIVIGAALLFCALARQELSGLALLQILMWAQITLIGTGKGLKELYKHYLYLTPESPVRKLLWSNLELALRTLIEGALIFGVGGGLILGESPVMILLMSACYGLFSVLLIAVNFLSLRWIRAGMTSGLMLVWYVVSVVVFMIPGLAAALVLGGMTGNTALGLLILSAWEFAAAILCFTLARGVLNRCDMPVLGEKM